MKKRNGYTWVELILVLLMVSILSAISTPLLRGRINAAKWSEGKAIAGSIATAIRSWNAETNKTGNWNRSTLPPLSLGLNPNDLDGTFFKNANFTWQVSYDGINLLYVVTVTPPPGVGEPEHLTLDNTGSWSE